jgi:limonene-1,2-epoxide hydrolase
MTTAIDLVTEFCDQWGKGADVDTLVGYFTDDAVYHNIPVDPVTGRDGIKATISMFMTGVERVEFEMRNISDAGNVVMTERIDRFFLPHTTIELPVMGIFEIEGDKIAAWRDYFDLNQYMTQLQGSAS